jgi:hypothetical protein
MFQPAEKHNGTDYSAFRAEVRKHQQTLRGRFEMREAAN